MSASSIVDASSIRALRGSLSRAAFARQLGVTAHTVYRWELPDGAEEARRPRGDVLEKLQRLAAGVPLSRASGGSAAEGGILGMSPSATSPTRTGDPAAVATAFASFARF